MPDLGRAVRAASGTVVYSRRRPLAAVVDDPSSGLALGAFV